MARWERAVGLLGLRSGASVLDVGCAFGYGTARLARRYRVEGIDSSDEYIARARRRYPRLTFRVGVAEALPYETCRFDGAVMLDVLEHLPPDSQGAALAEVARVLRPGGRLVLSVPNKGLLAVADSLNLFMALRGGDAGLAAMYALAGEPPCHRHYSRAELRMALAAYGLAIERVVYSGAGVAELVNLALLWLCWWPRPLRRLYSVLQYVYYGVYMVEDSFSLGPLSYHLMLVARRVPRQPSAVSTRLSLM